MLNARFLNYFVPFSAKIVCFLQNVLIFLIYNSYWIIRRYVYDREDGIKDCQSNGDAEDNK